MSRWIPHTKGLLALSAFALLGTQQPDSQTSKDASANSKNAFTASNCPPATVVAAGPRYLVITPSFSQGNVALLVTGLSPDVSCVSSYVRRTGTRHGTLGSQPVFESPEAWAGIVVCAEDLVSGMTYAVQVDCDSSRPGTNVSPPANATLWNWGDADNNNIVDILDIVRGVDGFSHSFNSTVACVGHSDCAMSPPNFLCDTTAGYCVQTRLENVDIVGANAPHCLPDFEVTIRDILAFIDAYGSPNNPCMGSCIPQLECIDDKDCSDQLFCNGVEACVDGTCAPGFDPCPGRECNETDDSCFGGFTCPTISQGIQVGSVLRSDVVEASGLAASRRNPNVLWTHDDSGGDNVVFALNRSGTLLGTYRFGTGSVSDAEDVALGPGPIPGMDYLFFGDIGDNGNSRASITVKRAPEPVVDAQQAYTTATLDTVDIIKLQYPTGAAAPSHKDAETLFVDLDGDLYIVTKRMYPNKVYRARYPQSTSATNTLEYVVTLPTGPGLNWITGGDLSADGQWIIVTNDQAVDYANLWYRPLDTDLSTALLSTPCAFVLQSEPQGEAIAWDPVTPGFFTLSEAHNNAEPIWYYQIR